MRLVQSENYVPASLLCIIFSKGLQISNWNTLTAGLMSYG